MDKIDVLMPIYREPLEYISKAINSILNQTYSNISIIIGFDDPTNINAIEYVKNLNDSRIRIIINEKNLGLVNNLNNMFKYCTANYIARMDADDISLPNRLEEQMKFLIKNDLSFVGSNVKWFVGDNEYIFETNYPIDQKSIEKIQKKMACFSHPTFLFKREVFEKIGGYKNYLYCEDYVFECEVILKGFKVGNVPISLLDYRLNDNGVSNNRVEDQYLISKLIRKIYKRKGSFKQESFDCFYYSKTYKKRLFKLKKYFFYKRKLKEYKLMKKILFILVMFFNNPIKLLEDIYNRRILKIIKKV